MRRIGAIVCLIVMAACEQGVGGECSSLTDCKRPLQCINSKCATVESVLPKEKSLPEHRFQHATRGRSQIRAIAKRGTLTRKEFEQLAIALANKHGAEFTLVQFFSDKTTLDGWDGSGTLRDSDWPHWLCQVGVDANSEGKRHVRSFSLGKDMKTGEDRKDVLKP